MFKYGKFHLTGPICSCEKMDLAWGIYIDDKAKGYKAGLEIICKTCGTKYLVSNALFKCGFILDDPYPTDREDEDGEIVELRKTETEEE